MNLHLFKRRSRFSTAGLFLLAACVGTCVFNLQVVSMVKLLQDSGLQFLPSLMVLQALSSWCLLRVWGKSAMHSIDKFFLSSLTIGIAVVMGSRLFPSSHPVYLGALFICSQLSISALRMGIHVTFSKRISILRNPQISVQLAMAEESGFLLGALTLALIPQQFEFTFLFLSLLPFVLGAFVFGALQKSIPQRHAAGAPPPRPNKRRPGFFNVMVGLFAVVASLKSIQWFGMAYGLDMAAKEGSSVLSVFSRAALLQSALTVSILGASFIFAKKIPTWTLGFNAILVGQALSSVVLFAFPGALVLVGAEIFRKVMEHGFLARSLQLLTASIPDEDRLEIRHLMERWSTTLGILAGGMITVAVVQGLLPFYAIWILTFLMAGVGMALRHKLFEGLNDFHVAHLNRARLDGIIQACQVLGNPDGKKHYAALTTLLGRGPRPIITKSILMALGRMQEKAVIAYASPFMDSDREDIQLAAVRALVGYKGHEVNLILLKKMREMVRSPAAIRLNVIRCITQRLERLVIPYFIELLESQPEERVVANAVEILGEISESENDEDLKSYLSKFLEHPASRRIRANAVVILLKHPKYRLSALMAFERLLTSEDSQDQDAAAFVAGRLRLHDHEAFIWERSVSLSHQNETLLIALHRLGNPYAPSFLAQVLIHENEDRALVSFTKLSMLDAQRRSEVFFEIIERWPDQLDLLLMRMRKSQREFDLDRELIREEAQRRGLKLSEEDAWTKEDNKALKYAA